MTGEQWLSFQQAVQAATDHGGISIGRARHLVRSAKASGEVDIRPGPDWLTADDGIVGMDLRRPNIDEFNKRDFLDWLDRHLFPALPKGKSPALPKDKGHRYPTDDKLVTRAVAGIKKKKWANALQAATALADGAKGTSRASTIDRLRKKISAAFGE